MRMFDNIYKKGLNNMHLKLTKIILSLNPVIGFKYILKKMVCFKFLNKSIIIHIK
jgi:hypothetical protein